jgi:hypothetical protein
VLTDLRADESCTLRRRHQPADQRDAAAEWPDYRSSEYPSADGVLASSDAIFAALPVG